MITEFPATLSSATLLIAGAFLYFPPRLLSHSSRITRHSLAIISFLGSSPPMIKFIALYAYELKF